MRGQGRYEQQQRDDRLRRMYGGTPQGDWEDEEGDGRSGMSSRRGYLHDEPAYGERGASEYSRDTAGEREYLQERDREWRGSERHFDRPRERPMERTGRPDWPMDHERGGGYGRTMARGYAMERERGAMQRGFGPADPYYERRFRDDGERDRHPERGGYGHEQRYRDDDDRYLSDRDRDRRYREADRGHRYPGRYPEERAYGHAPGWGGEPQGYGGYGRHERHPDEGRTGYGGGHYGRDEEETGWGRDRIRDDESRYPDDRDRGRGRRGW